MAELTAAATTPEPLKESAALVSGSSVVESMPSRSSPSCTESSDSESEIVECLYFLHSIQALDQ